MTHRFSMLEKLLTERRRRDKMQKNSFKRMSDHDGGIGRRCASLWWSRYGITAWNVAGDRRCLK